jgi:hypothetical protein
MNRPQLVADIVTTWLRRGQNRPTLCFATGRDHARALHERFLEAGVPSAYVDAFTPREERDQIGKALAAGEIRVVVNIGCLTTGIDWDVRCIILARPTKSEMLFVQIIGRGLRTADGKHDCIVLDHSDTHMRLGMVTDISFDLCDGNPKPKADREKKEKLPRCCEQCSALLPVFSKLCLVCGFELPRMTVQTADGELTPYGQHVTNTSVAALMAMGLHMRAVDGKLMVSPREKVTDEAAKIIREYRDEILTMIAPKLKSEKASAKVKIAQMGKKFVHAQLLHIADERSYSDQWAAHKYKAIFDVWPRGMPNELVSPVPELLSWVKSEQIKFAKSSKTGGGYAAA